MDYKKHYDRLINKGKNRTWKMEVYKERHHIIPRCLGGTDNSENLVYLTPEEHYVAHQLLVKMYPNHTGLLFAAMQMTGHSSTRGRSNNKIYGWLRRRLQKVAKQRTGKKNGSYGRYWYHNPDTGEVSKLLDIEADPKKGWIKGRTLTELRQCVICNKEFRIKNTKMNTCCSAQCRHKAISNFWSGKKKPDSKILDDESEKELFTRYTKGEKVIDLFKEYDISQRKAYYIIQNYKSDNN